MVKDDYSRIFKNVNRILAIYAHPDDAEVFSGGTLSRLVEDGKEVCVVKVTSGDKGSRQNSISQKELGNLREKEDAGSMEILGIHKKNNIYLHFEDGTVEDSIKVIGKIAEQIRIFKPDLLITHNPEDVVIRFAKDENWINHRDHRNTGKAAIDAAYPYSRDLLFFPEHFKNKEAKSYSVSKFLLVDYYDHPDLVYIDVSKNIATRIKAHSSHSSQYSEKDAKDSADFFTASSKYNGKRYERFRYVIAD
jgi:LmbE family N-acetylglucosaminyl deacetylase